MGLFVNVVPSFSGADFIGLPFFESGEPAVVGLEGPTPDARARRGFEGKSGQIGLFDVDGKTVVALGLGAASDVTLETLRSAAATFVRSATNVETAELALAGVAVDGADAAQRSQAVTEGVLLGSYRFDVYKSKADDRKLQEIRLVDADESGVERGTLISDAVRRTRDLQNEPPVTLTPTRFGEIASDLAREVGLDISVWDEAKIKAERLGGLLGVAAGSLEPPRFVKLTYAPNEADGKVALVGKGITFDTGGLSLKPPDSMIGMKGDMTGAAVVLNVMAVLPKLAPSVRVDAYLPLTENMPGARATKPGDILRARNGTTIEVLNTDAEGRLILADALALAAEDEPDAIIDIATLTGAVMVSLGTEIAGLMGNNDALVQQVKAASENVNEDLWQLPLPDKYRKLIDSPIADLKNIGPKARAGSSTAGLFLKEFVDNKPWVHLDIAGTDFADADDGHIVKGGTGFGVRTLIETIEKFTKP